MRTENPRVSVGVPVFNGEAFLEQALNALLNQTFTDFEIVISDNGSTDRTEQICRSYAARDARIRYYRNDINRGAAWNHNRVFELARGKYFKWSTADDLCAPEFLQRCVAALDEDASAVMACPNVMEIDQHGRPLETVTVPGTRLIPAESPLAAAHVRFREKIRFDHLCQTIYSVFRSDVLRRTDLIGNYSDSDRVLLAHVSLFGRCLILPEVLFFSRDHPGRFSRTFVGWRERKAWFDGSQDNRWTFPFWRELAELWGVISRCPLPFQERLRCYWEMVRWSRDNFRHLVFHDLAYYPKHWAGRRFPRIKRAWRSFWGDDSDRHRINRSETRKEVAGQGMKAARLDR